jgi:AcrR family transcriptional regulator
MQYLAQYGCKFSIDDMVKSLDMSKRTFYRYFESKEVLLMALVDLLTDEVQETMSAIAKDNALATDEKLYRVLTIETNFEKVVSFQRIPELEKYYPEV